MWGWEKVKMVNVSFLGKIRILLFLTWTSERQYHILLRSGICNPVFTQRSQKPQDILPSLRLRSCSNIFTDKTSFTVTTCTSKREYAFICCQYHFLRVSMNCLMVKGFLTGFPQIPNLTWPNNCWSYSWEFIFFLPHQEFLLRHISILNRKWSACRVTMRAAQFHTYWVKYIGMISGETRSSI